MSEKKNEQKKIYIAIGLALIMAVLCYFRFIHKKGTGTRDEMKIPYNPLAAELDIPEINTKMMKTDNWRRQHQEEPFPTLKRDIFVNVKSLNNAKNELSKSSPEESESGSVTDRSQLDPGLELTGTIVGGENPIAIINDQFVKVGDLIDEYKLVRIGKKEVILDMDGRTVKVEMLINE